MASSYPSAHLPILINVLGSTYLASIWTPSSTTKFHPKSGGWNSKLYGNDAVILLPQHKALAAADRQMGKASKQENVMGLAPSLLLPFIFSVKVWVSNGQIAVTLECPVQPQRSSGWQLERGKGSSATLEMLWDNWCTEGTRWQWCLSLGPIRYLWTVCVSLQI